MKVCSKCKETKPYCNFSKNRRLKDGYNNQCKSCINGYRTHKVNKGFAETYQKDLEDTGEKFDCKNCGNSYTAFGFYTKRDYGKVTLNLSKCKVCQKEYQRIKSFGISDKDYNNMLSIQEGCCKICKIPITEYQKTSNRSKRFAVDHCHKTGVIRGLLCSKCNQGLGLFKDDIQILKEAISYLEGNDMV